MTPHQMVHNANQIAHFFAGYPKEEAVAGVADHFSRFWEQRMRRQIFEYVDAGGSGLDGLVIEAIGLLRR